VLLEDPLPVDPVGKALVVQRPSGEMGKHGLGNPLVVAGEVGLVYVGREQDLVGTADPNAAATRADREAQDGTSRTTSRGTSLRTASMRAWSPLIFS
jgi:hypothetical protein